MADVVQRSDRTIYAYGLLLEEGVGNSPPRRAGPLRVGIYAHVTHWRWMAKNSRRLKTRQFIHGTSAMVVGSSPVRVEVFSASILLYEILRAAF